MVDKIYEWIEGKSEEDVYESLEFKPKTFDLRDWDFNTYLP